MKIQHPYLFLFLTAASLTLPCPARASCGPLVEGLKEKMDSYRSHREENQKNQASLLATETSCKATGAVITEKAATLSAGLSCQSQGDVSELNRQIEILGKNCETTFTELKAKQESLRVEFEETKADLDEGVKLMKEDDLIKEFCADEVKTAVTMTEAFLKLEANIVDVKSHAVTGEQNYSALKTTGQQLAAQTAALNVNCGAHPDAAPAAVTRDGMLARGEGSGKPAVPAGVSPVPASDITGSDKAIQAERQAERAIAH